VRALVVVAVAALLPGCRIGFDAVGTDDATSSGDVGSEDATQAAVDATQSTDTTSVMTVTSVTVGFKTPTTAGNAIVAFVWSWATGVTQFGPSAVTDALGNTYQLVASYELTSTMCSGGAAAIAIFLAPDIANAGPGHTVTANASGDGSQQLTMVAVEYHGLSPSPVLAGGTAALENGPSPLTVGSGVIDIPADTLLVSAATECGGFPNPVVWSSGEQTIRGIQTQTASIAPGIAGDRFETQAGFATATWVAKWTGADAPAFAVMSALR
jgi:hypothetical protein